MTEAGQKPTAIAVKNLYVEPSSAFKASVCSFTDASGNPVDVSAWTFRLHMKEGEGAATPRLALTEGQGLTVEGAAVYVSLSLEQVTANAGQVLVYDLRIDRVGLNPFYPVRGTVHFIHRVTE